MTRSRYSIRESLNRIVRLFEGDPLTSDTPEIIPGEVLSHDEALSDLAELLEGSLPDQTLHVPASMQDTYGAIYVTTGTCAGQQNLPNTSFTKVSGTFQNDGLYSSLITPQYAQDRILINDIGTYFVEYHASFIGSSAVNYTFEPYAGALMPEAASMFKPGTSGSAVHVSGGGFIYVSGTAVNVALYVEPDTNLAWVKIMSAHLTVRRVKKN